MQNKTLMQYFEWYLPENGLHWERCVAQAAELKSAGIHMVWLPPAYKGAAGSKSVGYDVNDTYDLGEFEQKGSVATKYGTKECYLRAVQEFQKNGIEVFADIVLNHMMGADGTEEVQVNEQQATNRNESIGDKQKIQAWTKFEFPGRNNKYSNYKWSAANFSGTDWAQDKNRGGIFRFEGKNWNGPTDSENGNYDYLMGVDLDTDYPGTKQAVTDWGKWYLDTVHMDGFRLDAVKHIDFDFYREWLKMMRDHAGKDFFVVGEYWSPDLEKLKHYLDAMEHSLSLFDVPLHFSFLRAATSDGNFDMSKLFEGSLVKEQPKNAMTFVDNHDTQPGQALVSFIPAWFKPIAYAIILLRKEGIPCVFYGDYYGIPHDRIPPVPGLKKLIKLRELFAYGEQRDYLDDSSVIGFTRSGDSEHPDSGMAVIATDSVSGTKKMQVGEAFAGHRFFDVMCCCHEPVILDETGSGVFQVDGGSVSVWVPEVAYRRICTEVE